jgi:lysine 2,3-aminomutase
MNRVRPYYIYQCDLERGLEHFRTSVETGMEIMEALRGWTTGFSVPTYVIDAPGGGGKIPIAPNYLLMTGESQVTLRNFEGQTFSYPQPAERDASCPYEAKWTQGQVTLPVRRKRRGVRLRVVGGQEPPTKVPASASV